MARQLHKLHFLIHPFCYADMTRGMETIPVRLQPYAEREQRCAERWRHRLGGFSLTDALITIPAIRGSVVLDTYLNYAASILGDRCFVLDCPDAFAPEFWSQDNTFQSLIIEELKPAFIHQKLRSNNEEIVTHLHCLACCQQLSTLFVERDYTFDAATGSGKGWGASFDGCVTKYTATLRRLLGLTQPITINFNLTIPDARFLLDASQFEWLELTDGLRLYVFDRTKGDIALFTTTSHSLADDPAFVTLPRELSEVTVLSKQGIRLWPDPQEYRLNNMPPEYAEPMQTVVTNRDGYLQIPISSGFVYRLAKAPAYIFAPPGVSHYEFVALLREAQVVQAQQP